MKYFSGPLSFLTFLIIFTLSYSCQKDEPIIQDPSDNECCEHQDTSKDETTTIPFLNHIWKHEVVGWVNGELNWFINYGIINTPHGVAVNYDGQSARGVTMFDKETGEILWEWNHKHYMNSFNYHKATNQLICHAWRDVIAINCENGNIINEFYQNNMAVPNPYGQLIGDHYFYTRSNNEDTKAWIVRSHISDLQNWEILYSIEKSQVGGSNPNVQSYNLWTDPISNDEILIFQHRMSLPNRVDLVAYNLTKNSLVWKHDDLCPNGKSNVRQIQIFKDRAYFLGVNTIYCVDIKSGEILWMDRHLEPLRSYLFGDVVYAEQEDLIIVKDDGTRLTAYEPESGNVAWEISDLSHNGVDITYFDGYVYIAQKPLFAVDAQTGEVFKDTEQSFDYQGMVAIDEEKRILFTANFSHLYAFEIED